MKANKIENLVLLLIGLLLSGAVWVVLNHPEIITRALRGW